MAVLESEILARAKAWAITGTLTPTARMEIGRQLQEEKERMAAAALNERYVAAMEEANQVARDTLHQTTLFEQGMASAQSLLNDALQKLAAADARAAAAEERVAAAQERIAADAEKT